MGSVSAMNSIDRVLKKHGRQLQRSLRKEYPTKLITRFELENQIYSIGITAYLSDGTALELKPLDIDELAQKYPDCKVGY